MPFRDCAMAQAAATCLPFGKSNSGKTQLVEIVGKFMVSDDFQGAIRTRLTAQTVARCACSTPIGVVTH